MLRHIWSVMIRLVNRLAYRAVGLMMLVASVTSTVAATAATTAATTDRYVIDPTHTYSIFEYSHWGLSLQQGRFEKNSGFIDIDSEKRTGTVQLSIDAASVSTGNGLFDTALRSSSFFDVQIYPTINFVSSALIFDEKNNVIALEGDLTIKNITKKVKFELTQFRCRFMPLYLKSACGANGNAKILRSDFDVGRYTPFVSDEVTLYFAVEAIKE
ncbi:YceI family protein [Undibacterium flavidum]|uniref:YceI family protein n=1 Tax=Undibacterium flavidum TaxID=2762297 RepID=A0ABR6YDR9_9BURK|nr:YceI family protein [Undibacterium flavidum]MBC3874702.1 YceI family protein [Undibacterium flavidum]